MIKNTTKGQKMDKPAIKHYKYYNPTWKEQINPIWWFKNVKWPEPPDWYIEEHAEAGRGKKWATFVWYIRNPFQNFVHYVIGISHHVTKPGYEVVGRDPNNLFSPVYNINWWVVKYKWMRLPGISFWCRLGKKNENIREQLNFHFQIGWKKNGNLGAALRRQIGL